MSLARIAELERRLANVVRVGVVASVDLAAARVTVTIGGLTTAKLPWLVGRARGVRTWSPPQVGEQVLVVAPAGELSQGFVLPSLYQSTYPAPSASADETKIVFEDGTVITQNKATKALLVEAPASGSIKFKVGATELTLTNAGTTLKTPDFAATQ
jgi:phage baseplate assembly protein V